MFGLFKRKEKKLCTMIVMAKNGCKINQDAVYKALTEFNTYLKEQKLGTPDGGQQSMSKCAGYEYFFYVRADIKQKIKKKLEGYLKKHSIKTKMRIRISKDEWDADAGYQQIIKW